MSYTKRLTLQRKFSNLSVAILQGLNDYLVDDFARSQDGDRWEQSLVPTLYLVVKPSKVLMLCVLLCFERTDPPLAPFLKVLDSPRDVLYVIFLRFFLILYFLCIFLIKIKNPVLFSP